MPFPLIQNATYTDDKESGWQLIYPNGINKGEFSVQIGWENAAGSLDGELKLYITNNPDDSLLSENAHTITIDSAAHESADETYITFNVAAEYIKAVYTANNVTSIDLSVYVSEVE